MKMILCVCACEREEGVGAGVPGRDDDEEEDGCRKAKSRKEVLCCFGSRFSLVLATKKEKGDKATMETEKWEDLSERDEVT